MKQEIKSRDLDAAIGMLLAVAYYKDHRDKQTPFDLICEAFEVPEDQLDFILESCDQHAEVLMEAVDEVNSRTSFNISTKDMLTTIKQSAVLAAISEMFMIITTGTGFAHYAISDDVLEGPISDETISGIMSGHDPAMLAMVSLFVVESSYPKENPTKEILAALFLQGFMVALLGPMIFDAGKDTSFVKNLRTMLLNRYTVID